MEPETVFMERSQQSNVSKERHPGDGMESYTIDDHIRSSTKTYSNIKRKPKAILPTNISKIKTKIKLNKIDKLDITETSLPDILNSTENSPDEINSTYSKNHEDLIILVESLKTQLTMYENHNNQLIEEKMKLSQQLGIQTQVNNELKNLLVASIGEDLQEKYERLILDKSHSDLEIEHLHNVLEEDREEVEQAMIQADVWRSKFLASRVMSDELAKWKSALYYKYRESYLALQNLLEEHSKIRALNNATKRGLTKAAELLHCKDPSLDTEMPLTTIDVAFMNNDIINSLLEIMTDKNKEKKHIKKNEIVEIKGLDTSKEKGKKLTQDIYIEASQLTHAEQLAHEVIVNTDIETEEIRRMRKDYLAHNRISHFLSTSYHVTFNCCENCKGPIILI